MRSEACRYDPPVAPGKVRQDAEQVRVGRSIVNQQELPIFIRLRQNRLDGFFEPFHRRIEHGREDADQWPRSERARLIAHPLQILCACAVLLEPLLVFGGQILLPFRVKFPPDFFSQSRRETIRREEYLANPALRGLAQPSSFLS